MAKTNTKPAKKTSKPVKIASKKPTTKTQKAAKPVATKTLEMKVSPTAAQKNVSNAITKFIRGLDNDTVAVKKTQESLNSKIEKISASVNTLNKLVAGLSNGLIASVVTPAKPSASIQKSQIKSAPVKAQSNTDKVEVISVDKSPTPAVKNDNKPSLKSVIEIILSENGTPMSAALIYTTATTKHGSWSRQSLYNALKDEKRFAKIGEGAEATYSLIGQTVATSVTDDEADSLIKKMADNSAPLSSMI